MTRRDRRNLDRQVTIHEEYIEVTGGFFMQEELEEFLKGADPEFSFQDPTDLRKVDDLKLMLEYQHRYRATGETGRLFEEQVREFPLIVGEVFRHNPIEIPIEQEVAETVEITRMTESQILEYFDRLSNEE